MNKAEMWKEAALVATETAKLTAKKCERLEAENDALKKEVEKWQNEVDKLCLTLNLRGR